MPTNDYYNSLSGYITMAANISLVVAIIFLFFYWELSIILFFFTLILWILSFYIQKNRSNLKEKKEDLMSRMIDGVELIKLGIFLRLENKYSKKYDEDFSTLLAAAVVNELYSIEPGNEKGKNFLDNNTDLVNKVIEKLKSNDEIRKAITQAIRVRQIIFFDEDRIGPSSFSEPIEKLMKLGLFIPGGEAPSPEKFIPMAKRFYESGTNKN